MWECVCIGTITRMLRLCVCVHVYKVRLTHSLTHTCHNCVPLTHDAKRRTTHGTGKVFKIDRTNLWLYEILYCLFFGVLVLVQRAERADRAQHALWCTHSHVSGCFRGPADVYRSPMSAKESDKERSKCVCTLRVMKGHLFDLFGRDGFRMR